MGVGIASVRHHTSAACPYCRILPSRHETRVFVAVRGFRLES